MCTICFFSGALFLSFCKKKCWCLLVKGMSTLLVHKDKHYAKDQLVSLWSIIGVEVGEKLFWEREREDREKETHFLLNISFLVSFATKYSQIVLLNYRLVRTFKCHYASRFQQVSVEVEKYLDKNLISRYSTFF